jgi:hydrogenase maturation protein HypF
LQTLNTRAEFRVEGLVQGVGFRPYVYRLAHELRLAGFVGNDAQGVFIEVEGPDYQLSEFHERLQHSPPPASSVDQIHRRPLQPKHDTEFVILSSREGGPPDVWVSPDLDCCEECLSEVLNPQDRRYLYPFANCTHCGPRYTLIQGLPYDRSRTTMASFSLCSDCAAEYEDPRDRRFHAQPIACGACGPQLSAGLQETVAALERGEIVALKGVGGYHLVADAEQAETVQRLREGKRRLAKPMAVMVADLDGAEEFAELSTSESELLLQPAKPIVLLQSRQKLPEALAPGLSTLGVMLPYSPLHHLLFRLGGFRALVMTSGNLSGQPIASTVDQARSQMDGLADRFVDHDRPIEIPCDDSVMREFRGAPLPIRRSRGFAPFPVKLPHPVAPSLAVGAQMKSTFCLGVGRKAYLSQHLGDLDRLETLDYFERVVKHLSDLYRVNPEYVCCDSHPDMLSSRWAEDQGLPVVKVQHHHAHLASALTEHGLESALGIILDGTGYGDDGTIWGGEILVGDFLSFERVAFLKPVPLAGGDKAVKEPWRMALSHLWSAGLPWAPELPCVQAAGHDLARFQKQLERGLNCVQTSSAGRLFDAVAALCGLTQLANYEAEAAIMLEHIADHREGGSYRFGEPWDAGPMMSAVLEDLEQGVEPTRISMKFHRGLAEHLVALATRHHNGLPVVLSGGVFQNILLTELMMQEFEKQKMNVYTHRRIPPNDGGVSLGQLMVGAARTEAGGATCA